MSSSMIRAPRYPNLPPIYPEPLYFISSPPSPPPRARALPMSPAHIRLILLAEARPRYPISYIALSPNPRSLSLAFKLATAPREPGPVRISPSNRYLIPEPKSRVLDRYKPLSMEKNCPCPLSRRCDNWRPSPPRPQNYCARFPAYKDLPKIPKNRMIRALEPHNVEALFPMSTRIPETCHALIKRIHLDYDPLKMF